MSLQDILGQLPLLKSYTHILLCFSLPDSEREPVLEALQCATKRLLAAFPFLAGIVVHSGVAPGDSGTFAVEGYDDNGRSRKAQELLSIKDLTDALPPYSAVYSAHAPPSMLPGSLVAPPRAAFPRIYTEDAAPVLEMQASLVRGGLLLDIAAQHNVIDATGIFYIAHLLSKLMDDHPNPIPHADLLLGNCSRQDLIPLLPPDEPLPDEMNLFTKDRPPQLDRETLSAFKWYLLRFTAEALSTIHAEANSHPEDFVEGIASVSVNDAITAFCWQRLTLARTSLYSFSSDEAMTQLTRAADLRRTLNLSPAYMGHMVRTANLRLPTSTVTTSSLSKLSSLLRDTVAKHTAPHSVRSYATLLHRTRDKNRVLYAGGFNALTDFSCSSVAHVALPRFGAVLGTPDFVRRPTFGPLPAGMYVAPGRGGEGGDAVVCLREGEMDALRRDELWRARVSVIE
ncbi:uncharacterized protein BJX67DRAFT_383839 [Aspergillus lucknowensis]|uniref:Trichothecene 3-O-acetyltransferase-like N-terminal domain-containing protein n=1 Tax=Aspergillus lucknowensis TaxID=176173 RepID=A0ABR4LIL2_9EURO